MLPALAEIAKQTNTPVIDIYKAMSGKGEMVPDGVHPNEHGYKVMAEAIASALKSK